MEVVILCGGKGSRLAEETSVRPKPMVEIGGKPILWHIMKIYSNYGYKKFVLALGYKASYIKEYFYSARINQADFTLKMEPNTEPIFHNSMVESDWEISFIDTGEDTLKGGRLKKIEQYIKGDDFFVTYGDGVADVNIRELYKFHKFHNKIATVTAVHPPSRFGEIDLRGNEVISFEEKPQMATGYINGGFFVFKKDLLNHLYDDENCDLEFGALQKIAENGQLNAFIHNGFWQCMDNVRERDYLNELVQKNKAVWLK
jgi:glucose-1-phosphate cytidylyltransferase